MCVRQAPEDTVDRPAHRPELLVVEAIGMKPGRQCRIGAPDGLLVRRALHAKDRVVIDLIDARFERDNFGTRGVVEIAWVVGRR